MGTLSQSQSTSINVKAHQRIATRSSGHFRCHQMATSPEKTPASGQDPISPAGSTPSTVQNASPVDALPQPIRKRLAPLPNVGKPANRAPRKVHLVENAEGSQSQISSLPNVSPTNPKALVSVTKPAPPSGVKPEDGAFLRTAAFGESLPSPSGVTMPEKALADAQMQAEVMSSPLAPPLSSALSQGSFAQASIVNTRSAPPPLERRRSRSLPDVDGDGSIRNLLALRRQTPRTLDAAGVDVPSAAAGTLARDRSIASFGSFVGTSDGPAVLQRRGLMRGRRHSIEGVVRNGVGANKEANKEKRSTGVAKTLNDLGAAPVQKVPPLFN
jgi:hypothetical protein